MKNLIQKGKTIDYLIPESATITSGQLVAIGDVVGVAVSSGVEGETIAVSLSGVYLVGKVTGVLTQGQKVYFNASQGKVTGTASTNKFVGWAYEAAANGAPTVGVKLIG
jgi:predicted RecA/RadA family phage recombinase